MTAPISSKTIVMGTDVAAFVLFHPGDLAHRESDPIAWYSYDFAYRRESREGRLVAFVTGSDGGYEIRLTTGPLSAAEAQRACPHWEFPLVVRRGAVLLDNTDALPGEEQMVEPSADSDAWFELANGSYRVTVYPMSWGNEEEDADAPDRLPDYVITFEVVSDISSIAVAIAPPTLKRDGTSPAFFPVESDYLFEWPRKTSEGGEYILPVDAGLALLPGGSATVVVGEDVAEATFPERSDVRVQKLVVAPTFGVGDLAMLARASGLSRSRDDAPVLSVQGLYPVRVMRGVDAQPLARVTVVPVDKPIMPADGLDLEGFRGKLLHHAQRSASLRDRLPNVSFELERLEALQSVEAVTGWALHHLELPWRDAWLAMRAGLHSALPF